MTTALQALDALTAGIAAARVLELDVDRAEAIRAEAAERLGIAPDAYVLALVGGTGVGKSSIVNALAGETVTPAGVRRPTTARAIAWIPGGGAGRQDAAREGAGRDGAGEAAVAERALLRRLDAEVVRTGSADGLGNVIVLDLPDIDSLEPGNRAAVEAVLPKVDVVAWVTDPEKYADAVFHDTFLRDWLPRLDRQIVLLNKTDRLSPEAARSIAADLAAVLRRELPGLGARTPEVLATRAVEGEDGVAELRRWLGEAVDAKAIVAGRLVASAAAALADLAGRAGVAAAAAPALIPEAERERVVDLPGVERQAVAATRARARRRGTGPIGLITSGIYRATGRMRASADPRGYLAAWRARGGLSRAGEVVRGSINAVIPSVAPQLRASYAAAARAGDLEQRIGTSVDRVIAAQPPFEPPTSNLWPLLGLLQTANTVLLAFAAAWTVIWIIARPEVASYDLPVLGPMPAPLVLLAIGVIAGYVLARLLSLHAGWLGRRWARRVSRAITSAVRETVAADAFAAIARIEEARAALAAAWRSVAEGP
ncbi:MAG TPA: dynamin family protein [Candidatus Limnocylindrales bacterium]|nr:dynamin family protein [Candidatus Limnocylindrales bacterium]